MAVPVITTEGLVKRYGEEIALDGIRFQAFPGEIFALLGPNGAGKTTLVEILEGLRSPTSGKVSVLGVNVVDQKAARGIRNRIGVLPQEFSSFARLTVEENLEFFAGMYDKPASVDDLMELLGLATSAKKRFSHLSGGLRQRVGLAAALVNDPELLFLDEPTTGLDPQARRTTWEMIRGLRARGKTVFMTTHYMDEAKELADRVAILVKGRVAALDTSAGLLRTYGGGRAMIFKEGGDAVFGTLRRFFDSVTMEGKDVVLPFDRLRDLEVALSAVVSRGLEVEVSLRTPTVEEVFFRLAGTKISDSGEAN